MEAVRRGATERRTDPKAAAAQAGQMIWRRSSALVSKPPQHPLVTRCSLGKHHAATREQFKVAARTTGPVIC